MAINFDPKDLAKMASILSKDSPFLSTFQQEMLGEFEPTLHVNTKTVFANPLAIQVRMSDMHTLMDAEQKRTLVELEKARDKLLRTVANETRCNGCPNFDIRVDEARHLTTGSTDYRLRSICKLESNGKSSVICPDGTISAKDGSTTSVRMPPLAVFEPSEMSMREARRRDEPTTNTGDTAW